MLMIEEEEEEVVLCLVKYVNSLGGEATCGHLGQFYAEHPNAKAIIGKLSEFCERHAELQFDTPGKIRVVEVPRGKAKAKSKSKSKQIQDTAAPRLPPAAVPSVPSSERQLFLRLGDIRFSQLTYRATFTCGRSIADTAHDLREGKTHLQELPKISVVDFHGYWFSLDHRRLRCLQEAFGLDKQVPVLVKDLDDAKIKKEFNQKFTAGLAAARTQPNSHGIRDAATAFVVGLCTQKELDIAKEDCRRGFEQQLQDLEAQRDAVMAEFDGWKQRLNQSDDAVKEGVLHLLSHRGPLGVTALHYALASPPSIGQLRAILEELLSADKLLCIQGSGDPRYAPHHVPRMHPQLTLQKYQCKWSLVSSAATRSHAQLDGRSLACQNAFVACTVSLVSDSIGSQIVFELDGDWNENDKVLIGFWPKQTDTSIYYSSPGPQSNRVESVDHVRAQQAPGFWISCSSGRWLSASQNLSPVEWSAPVKTKGVRWGLRLSARGVVDVACAAAGEELHWGTRKWFKQPEIVSEPHGYAPAVLVQPHQRPDASQARLTMEIIR